MIAQLCGDFEHADDDMWLIEPNLLTSGTLRVNPQICNPVQGMPGMIGVMIMDWDEEECVLEKGAFIATAKKVRPEELTYVDTEEENNDDKETKEDIPSVNVEETENISEIHNIHNVKSFTEWQQKEKERLEKEKVENTNIGPELKRSEAKLITDLIQEFHNVVAKDPVAVEPLKDMPKFNIEIGDATPVMQKPYPINPVKREQVLAQLKTMEEGGIIEPKENAIWLSPLVCTKKADGGMRLAVDYRILNSVTKPISQPLPELSNLLDNMGNEEEQLFTTMDLASGFWEVECDDAAKELLAFSCGTGKVWTFARMPFGVKNGPAFFSQLINRAMGDLIPTVAIAFIDDLCIASGLDIHEHIRKVRLVLKD